MKKLLVFLLVIISLLGDELQIAGASQLKDNLPVVEQNIIFERFASEMEEGMIYRKNKKILAKEIDEKSYDIIDEDKNYKASKSYTDKHYEETGEVEDEYKVLISNQFYKRIDITSEILYEKELPQNFYLKEGWQGYSKVEAPSILFVREEPFTIFRVLPSDIGSKYVEE